MYYLDVKVSLTKGLSDTYAIHGQPVELACTISSDKVDGVWKQDDETVSSHSTIVNNCHEFLLELSINICFPKYHNFNCMEGMYLKCKLQLSSNILPLIYPKTIQSIVNH